MIFRKISVIISLWKCTYTSCTADMRTTAINSKLPCRFSDDFCLSVDELKLANITLYWFCSYPCAVWPSLSGFPPGLRSSRSSLQSRFLSQCHRSLPWWDPSLPSDGPGCCPASAHTQTHNLSHFMLPLFCLHPQWISYRTNLHEIHSTTMSGILLLLLDTNPVSRNY